MPDNIIKLIKTEKVLNILALITIAVVLLNIRPTNSTIFVDVEKSENNIFKALPFDLEEISPEDNFDPFDNFGPGTSGQRNVDIKNPGGTSFIYRMEYDHNSGDTGLCDLLDLTVLYVYDDGGIVEQEIYTGPLADFDISYDGNDPDFDHMSLDPGEENNYLFEVLYPEDAGDLDDTSCLFDIKATAWQTAYSPGTAFWDEEALTSELLTEEEAEEGLTAPLGAPQLQSIQFSQTEAGLDDQTEEGQNDDPDANNNDPPTPEQETDEENSPDEEEQSPQENSSEGEPGPIIIFGEGSEN